MFAAVYTAAPATKPVALGKNPPLAYALSISSNDKAEMRTPEPKAITAATTRCGTAVNQAIKAPRIRAEPLSDPKGQLGRRSARHTPSDRVNVSGILWT